MYLQNYKSTYIFFRKVSKIKALFYRLIIVVIYLLKTFCVSIRNIFKEEDHSLSQELLNYYRALINLMLFKLNDPNYPFPTN